MAKKKQEAKLKEPVRIRFKQLANGNQSIYLDYYTGDVILWNEKGTDTDVITVESIDINETFVLHISFMGAVIINSSMLS